MFSQNRKHVGSVLISVESHLEICYYATGCITKHNILQTRPANHTSQVRQTALSQLYKERHTLSLNSSPVGRGYPKPHFTYHPTTLKP